MKFIKLSTVVINPSKITSIRMVQNKYYINVLHTSFAGIHMTFFGSIGTYENRFEVCKEKDKEDYRIMTNWIHMNTDDCTS
jgi:hypothetical protein